MDSIKWPSKKHFLGCLLINNELWGIGFTGCSNSIWMVKVTEYIFLWWGRWN